jgi:hypothetical protein
MATIVKVKRLNPHHRRAGNGSGTGRRRNRRMTPKQIKFFGTRRQKAALRSSRRRRNVERGFYNRTGFHPLRRSVDYDPDRASDDYGSRSDSTGFGRHGKKRKSPRSRARRRTTNPGPLVVTLGAVNPRRRKTKVATRRRRRTRRNAGGRFTARPVHRRRRRRVAVSNPRRRRRAHSNGPVYHRRRRRNPPRVVVRYRRRRSNARHHRRRSSRNPSLFGHSITSTGGLKLIGGGIVGVAAAKFLPTMLPSGIVGTFGSSAIGRVVITGASAVAAGWAAGKVDKAFGEGVLFGGLMQAASVALNAFLPGFSIGGVPLGMGDLMNGSFTVPQNPIRAAIPPPPPANARVTMNGLARAYGAAY